MVNINYKTNYCLTIIDNQLIKLVYFEDKTAFYESYNFTKFRKPR